MSLSPIANMALVGVHYFKSDLTHVFYIVITIFYPDLMQNFKWHYICVDEETVSITLSNLYIRLVRFYEISKNCK